MNRFTYTASTSNGDLVAGEISAETIAHAAHELESQGLTIRAIETIPLERIRADEELAEFHRHLDDLLSSKSRWLPALTAMTNELPAGGVKTEMQRLVQRISIEMTTAEFLASRDANSLLPLLAAGLHSDANAHCIHDWLDSVSQQIERRVRRRQALIYPLVLLGLAFSVLALFAIFLVPVFKAMFTEFGLTLPAPTTLAIALSDQLIIHYKRTLIALLCSGLGVYAFVYVWRRYALTNRIFGRLVSGTSANLSAMSAFTSMLAELLSFKAPLPVALRIAGQSCQHRYFEDASLRLATEFSGQLATGYSSAARKMPPLVLHALQCGENSRPNIRLLRELSRVYSERLSARLNLVADVFPVLVTFCIGLAVGFIVIALFMPLVSLVTALS